MMTEEMKKAVLEMISEYMEGAESETEKLMEKVACALAERMDVSALEKHAVHEVGQMLDYYGMENVEGVFHEFYELKIVMCALRKHFPEGMTSRIWRDMQKNSELNNMFGYFSSLLLDLDPEAFERSLFL